MSQSASALYVNGNQADSLPGDAGRLILASIAPDSSFQLAGEVTGNFYALNIWELDMGPDSVRDRYEYVSTASELAPLSYSLTVTLSTRGVNTAPVILPQTLYVPENSPASTYIGMPVEATDVDIGQLLSFRILTDPSGFFRINPCDGQLTLISSVLDFEKQSSYSVLVEVSDNGDYPEPLSASAIVTIIIMDVNESPAVSDVSISVAEFWPVEANSTFSWVTKAVAWNVRDPDVSRTTTLSYCLLNSFGACVSGMTPALTNTGLPVRINAATGAVSLGPGFDFDTTSNPHIVSVEVSDNDPESPIAAGAKLIITLTNVDELPMCSVLSCSFDENNSAGVSCPLSCEDPEGGSVTLGLESGLDSPTGFSIENNRLVLSAHLLNFEAKSEYSFRLTAFDGAVHSNCGAQSGDWPTCYYTFKVFVRNLNEGPILSPQTLTALENMPRGAVVGLVIATDVDAFDRITFSISSQSVLSGFVIDKNSGELAVDLVYLDYEVQSLHTLSVTATDSDGLSSTSTVTLLVININEAVSLGFFSCIDAEAFENLSVGSIICSVDESGALTDKDGSDANFGVPSLVFSLDSAGNEGGVFDINSEGGIVLMKELDFESVTSYNLNYRVKDYFGGAGFTTATVVSRINVLDSPEPPAFELSPFRFNVPENSVPGFRIGSISIRDPDAGDSMAFAITDINGSTEDLSRFNIKTSADSLVGDLVLNTELNRQLVETYTLSLNVTDSTGLSQAGLAVITLTDANFSPICLDQSFTVSENAEVGKNVGKVVASDQDENQSLRYSILNWVSTDRFNIDGSTGYIRVNYAGALNYEPAPGPIYKIRVIVRDDYERGALEDDCQISIIVSNVNEAPVFNDISLTIAENSAVSTLVGPALVATDEDGDSLTFSIMSGNTNGAFAITSGGGQLSINNPSAINYEGTTAEKTFNLAVNVLDSGTPERLSITAIITITVTNANDPPKFPGSISLNILENSLSGSQIGLLTSSDEDVGQISRYSISPADNDGRFILDGVSGKLSVGSIQLDYEGGVRAYTLAVVVTDNGGVTPGWANASRVGSVTINVLNVNEAPTISAAVVGYVNENAPVGSVVTAKILGADVDAGDVLSYSLAGEAEALALFQIDSAKGIVTTKALANLNRELRQNEDGSYRRFFVTAVVTDSGGRTASVSVQIEISDVNEAPLLSAALRSIDENSVSGTFVGAEVRGTDVDLGQTSTLLYSISKQTNNRDATVAAFSIEATTGQLKWVLSDPPNFEAMSLYKVTVKATDSGGLFSEAVVTVNIVDVNEPPSFTQLLYTGTVAENSIIHVGIAASGDEIYATDVDIGQSLRFSISDPSAGSVNLPFMIDACSGIIRVARSGALDFETKKQYTFEITVMDDGLNRSPLSATAEVTVNILDVNEAPVLSRELYSGSVAENASGSSLDIALSATDVDEAQQGERLIFSITGGSSIFEIIPSGPLFGASLQLISGVRLDFESAPFYRISIFVTDSGSPNGPALVDTAYVDITVTNINEPPRYTGVLALSVPENSGAGVLLNPALLAEDDDVGQVVSFSLRDPVPTPFTISTSGQVSVLTASLDFETQSSFLLYVMIRDNGNPILSMNVTVSVAIIDVNEPPTLSNFEFSIYENSPIGTRLGILSATDPDAGDLINYRLIGGSGLSFFGLEIVLGSTFLVTKAAPTSTFLNYESTVSYTVQLQASDRNFAGNGFTVSSIATIFVLNVNEAPTIPANIIVSINENTAVGSLPGFWSNEASTTVNANPQTTVLPFFGIDPDGPSAVLRYTLEDATAVLAPNDNAAFDRAITLADGGCKLISASSYHLDFETGKDLSVVIRVFDESGASSVGSITVRIIDRPDPPNFAFDGGLPVVVKVNENSPVGYAIGSPIVATDEDGSSITYNIVEDSESSQQNFALSAFKMDRSSGRLSILNKADLVVPAGLLFLDFTFYVSAVDTTGLVDFLSVTVRLLKGNNAPLFSASSYLLSVQENSPKFSKLVGSGFALSPNTDCSFPPGIWFCDEDAADRFVGKCTFEFATIGDAFARELFEIDQITGEIYVRNSSFVLDYETQTQYALVITLRDSGNNNLDLALEASASVIINILDVQEPPTLAAISVTVSENVDLNTQIGSELHGIDPDIADAGKLEYVMSTLSPVVPFVVSKRGSVSYLVTSGAVDFERISSYSFSIVVTDTSGNSGVALVDIQVQDLNEAPSLTPRELTVNESAVFGTAIGAISSTDPDTNPAFRDLFYTISDPSLYPNFSIDRLTGVLRVAKSLDYESNTVLSIPVTVTDGSLSTSLSATKSYSVLVTDSNDLTIISIRDSLNRYGSAMRFGTGGGEAVIITGTNLGPTSDALDRPAPIISLTYVAYVNEARTLSNSYSATDCFVKTPNIEVECKLASGIGHDFKWTLTVTDGTAAAYGSAVTAADQGSYYSPAISSVIGSLLTPSMGGPSNDTTIMGSNFGPVGTVVRVSYGFGYLASNCVVVEAAGTSASTAVCTSSPGIGTNFDWTVTVGSFTSQPFSSSLFGYKAPTLNLAIRQLDGGSILDTRGSEVIVIKGLDFGPYPTSSTPPYLFNYGGYYAVGCVVHTPHTELRCFSVAGIGKELGVSLMVAGQYADIPYPMPLSYAPPVAFTPFLGSGTKGGLTNGGQIVLIGGDFFGPADSSPGSIVAAYGGSFFSPILFAADCFVSIAHVQITCLTSAGTGENHSWNVTVGGQTVLANADTSYAPPQIMDLYGVGAAGSRTEGLLDVFIIGRNFGLKSTNAISSVTYGPLGHEYMATSCFVDVDHTLLKCMNVEGAGKDHRWIVAIDGQTAISPYSSYGAPEIHDIYGARVQNASTAGGDIVYLSGLNFGPMGSKSYLDSVTYGPTGVEYTAGCDVTSHVLLECAVAAGVGSNLKWIVRVADQSSTPSAATVSYDPPIIVDIDPAFFSTDSAGEVEGLPSFVTITGRNFGVRNRQLSNTKLFFGGEPMNGWRSSYDAFADLDIIFFNIPEGLYRSSNGRESVYVTVGADSSLQRSSDVFFEYSSPTIVDVSARQPPAEFQEIMAADPSKYYLLLEISGSSFGIVPDQQPLAALRSYVLVNGGMPQLYRGSYFVTFSHSFITVLVDSSGYSTNTVMVCVGDRCSDVAYFYDFDPTIVSFGNPGEFGSDGFLLAGRQTTDCALGVGSVRCDFYAVDGERSKAASTLGGGMLSFFAKFVGFFPLPTVTVAGFPCLDVSVSHTTESGVDFAEPSTYNDSKLRLIKCYLPAGIGKEAPLVLTRNDNRDSNVVPFAYKAPTLTSFSPSVDKIAFSSTLGGDHLTILGSDFGVPFSGQSAYVLNPDLSRWSCRVVAQVSHDSIVIELPEGEGADKVLVLDFLGYTIKIQMRYKLPEFEEIRFSGVVHDPADPLATGPPTTGNMAMIISGDNFGRLGLYGDHQAVIKDDEDHSWSCFFVGADHTNFYCVLPPGQGKFLDLVVTIAGQSVTFKRVLSYQPPIVNSVRALDYNLNGRLLEELMFDTRGGMRVVVEGSNFGLAEFGRIRINGLLVGDVLNPFSVFDYNHTSIVVTIPAGQGVRKPITVEAGLGANVQFNSPAYFFSYSPPSIDITHGFAGVDYLGNASPTQGGFSISLRGANFGTRSAVVEVKVARYRASEQYDLCSVAQKCSGVCCQTCLITAVSHTGITCTIASGIGGNLPVWVTVADPADPGAIPRVTSESVFFSYDPPELDSQQLIQQSYNAYYHVNLVLTGKNLGESLAMITVDGYGDKIPLEIKLGNVTCPEPAWSNTDVEVGVGVSHLRCPQTDRTTVGWKNITVTVAGRTVFSPRLLFAKCYNTFYGQYGELCTPCQYLDANVDAKLYGAECPSVFNVNQDPLYKFEDGSPEILMKVLPCPVSDDKSGDCAKQYPFQDRWLAPVVDASDAVESSEYTYMRVNETGVDEYVVQYLYVEPFSRKSFWGFRLPTPDDRCEPERLHRSHCLYFAQCRPEEACIGNNECGVAYTGERCTECNLGFYRLEGVCEKCPDCKWCIPVMFVVAVLVGGTIAYYLKKKNVNIGILSIGVDYFQILALFASSDVAYPDSLQKLFVLLSAFNINLNLSAPECLSAFTTISYPQKWLFIEFLPIVIAVLFMMGHWSIYVYKRVIMRKTSQLHGHINGTINTALMFTYYLYLFVSKTTLEIFNCSPLVPSDGYEYMEADFIRCYTGTHAKLLPVAVIFFFFYTVGYPLFVARVLFTNRKKCQEDQLLRARGTGDTLKSNPNCFDFRSRYHALYYHFKPANYYWILIVLWRKFMIVITSMMFRGNITFQLCLSIMVMFLAYALQVKNNPYMSMSERPLVVADHEARLAEESAFLHANMRQAEGLRRARSNIKLGDAWGKKDFKMAREITVSFFWNYNTMESILLFSAVIVNMSGIMFQSGKLSQSNSSWDREFLTYVVILVVSLSVSYWSIVFISEIMAALCPTWLPKFLRGEVEIEKKSAGGTEKGEMQKKVEAEEEEEEEEEEDIDEKSIKFAMALPTTASEIAAAQQAEVIAAQQAEIGRMKKEQQMLALKAYIPASGTLSSAASALSFKSKKKNEKKSLLSEGQEVEMTAFSSNPMLAREDGAHVVGVQAAVASGSDNENSNHFGEPGASGSSASAGEWYPVIDPSSGKMYYVNPITKETSWTLPQ